jgi:DNA-binding MarR family transcriptional regulator
LKSRHAQRGPEIGERVTQGGATPPQDPPGGFPYPLTTYLFHLFTTIGRLRDAKLDKALRPLGLNVSRHRAVAVIALIEPCTMSELADLSAIDRTTMTRIVDQLVVRALVERATSDADRRQVVIRLTDAGRAVYRKALRVIDTVNRAAIADLPEDALQTMARTQQAILENLAPDAERARRLLDFRRG